MADQSGALEPPGVQAERCWEPKPSRVQPGNDKSGRCVWLESFARARSGDTQKRQELASNYSVLAFIFDKAVQDPLKLTANISASLYHKPDPLKKQQALRDVSGALSFDFLAGRSPFLTNQLDQSPVTISFSGRYQRMPENRGMPKTKADIGIAQAKVQFPVAAGVSLPLSITDANASELIHEKHVRANFGITFDLDKLSLLSGAARLPKF